MVLPALAAGASLAVSTYQAYRKWRDDSKYWADYQKNTGFRPRYKTKHYYDPSTAYSQGIGFIGRRGNKHYSYDAFGRKRTYRRW